MNESVLTDCSCDASRPVICGVAGQNETDNSTELGSRSGGWRRIGGQRKISRRCEWGCRWTRDPVNYNTTESLLVTLRSGLNRDTTWRSYCNSTTNRVPRNRMTQHCEWNHSLSLIGRPVQRKGAFTTAANTIAPHKYMYNTSSDDAQRGWIYTNVRLSGQIPPYVHVIGSDH